MSEPNPPPPKTDPPPPAKKEPTRPFLWLVNNASWRGFPLPAVKNKITGQTTADASPLSLGPGANLVDAKKWAALKKAEIDAAARAVENGAEPDADTIARLLTAKIPRATHKNREQENHGRPYLVEGPAVASKAAPLDGLPDAEAIGIVTEIRNLDMVNRLLQVEKRPAVNEALHRVRAQLTQGMGGAA